MAFGIKQIKALLSSNGMPMENLDAVTEEICGRHTADLDSIKEERDTYKKDAEKLASVQGELESLKNDPYEVKYTALKEQFEQFKQEKKEAEIKAAKDKAYRVLLAEIGVNEKRIDAVMKVTNLDAYDLDEQGAIKDADAVKETAKAEWADFITSTTEQGAVTTTPPKNTGGKIPLTDIYKRDEHGRFVMSTEDRQKAIAANLNNKGA